MIKMFKVLSILTAAIAFLNAFPLAFGQTGTVNPGEVKALSSKPAVASQAYVVMTGQSIADAIKSLQSENKTQNLISGEAIGCRVFIQHEKDVSTGQAEVHDGADDVFLILEGSATLTLGGKLDSPKQTQSGEWRASSITGGRDVLLRKGDLVIVPRGTPHRRTTPGQEVTLMVIKAFAPAVK